MTDQERNTIMSDLHSRKSEKLLRDMVNWYYNDMGNGNLSNLIRKIETHLEESRDEEKDDISSQTAKCPNPFCKGYSV